MKFIQAFFLYEKLTTDKHG